MCDTCGCSAKSPAKLTLLATDKPDVEAHDGSGTPAGSVADKPALSIQSVAVLEQDKRLSLSQSLLMANDRVAAHNREHFLRQGIVALNLISAPGSGKTTLLEGTLTALAGRIPCAVIEGDQATSYDAERINATGCPVVQVNTGAGCHLEANMVHEACHALDLQDGSLVFIENVGNLVCPSMFDLGEACKVVLLSVTEGDDKPLKYPHIFRASDIVIINKCDLLPYVNFQLDRCMEFIRQLNPTAQILTVTATDPQSLQPWLDTLQQLRTRQSR